MCFGCSKEPSHRDGSFEYPQHMFWLRNEKMIFIDKLLSGVLHDYLSQVKRLGHLQKMNTRIKTPMHMRIMVFYALDGICICHYRHRTNSCSKTQIRLHCAMQSDLGLADYRCG